ncbi:hypothetical protein GGX14DRAFT_399355 [Mycena pura]|uniref:Uncharacterized protein n=1 Tax=Mycena pura TaxID=153505 RepID=A0AAD6V6Z9_9AGAR|nr:hypothetical protein GGX14DRAFT_399355 [Mycena pura]
MLGRNDTKQPQKLSKTTRGGATRLAGRNAAQGGEETEPEEAPMTEESSDKENPKTGELRMKKKRGRRTKAGARAGQKFEIMPRKPRTQPDKISPQLTTAHIALADWIRTLANNIPIVVIQKMPIFNCLGNKLQGESWVMILARTWSKTFQRGTKIATVTALRQLVHRNSKGLLLRILMSRVWSKSAAYAAERVVLKRQQRVLILWRGPFKNPLQIRVKSTGFGPDTVPKFEQGGWEPGQAGTKFG